MIKVENVSMKFRMNNDNVNSLKEFVIAAARHKLKYKDFWVFQDVSFEVKKGEVVGIIGRNGAGKSTLLKIISGILAPTSGRVELGGRVVPMLELGSGFDFELTGRENIFLNGAILGCSEQFLMDKYEEILSFSELGDFIETPIRNYSSGMMMRLAFSIATIVQPEILIVDEILAVGDEAFQKKSRRKMLELMGGGTTVLFVSHSIAQIREMCGRTVWLENGKVRMQGETKYVCDKYQEYMNPVEEDFSRRQKVSDVLRNMSDVLFIYGDGKNAYEWRVACQREQLVAGAVPTNEVYDGETELDMAGLYRMFICVGCRNTYRMREFLSYAARLHKSILFDFSYCHDEIQKDESQKDERKTDESDEQKSLLEYVRDSQNGILVSDYELEQKYKKQGYHTFLNPLCVQEELLRYAAWAVYDREVLPFVNKAELSEEELVNYNRALKKHRQHLEDGKRIVFFLDNPADEKSEVENKLSGLIREIRQKQKLAIRIKNGQEWKSKQKLDMIRNYSEADIILFTDYRMDGQKEKMQDWLLQHWIYASLVKVPCFLLTKKKREYMFLEAGRNLWAGNDKKEFHKFVLDENLQKQIAENAYQDVLEHCCSVRTGDALAQFVRKQMNVNAAMLVSDLSMGDAGWIACHHAALLKKQGYDVLMLTTGQCSGNVLFDGVDLPVISRDTVYSYRYFDIMAAFDWQSAQWIQDYTNVGKRYYIVRRFETDDYPPGSIMRLKANQMYTPHVDMEFVTASAWCQAYLLEKYGRRARLVREGTAYEALGADGNKFQNRKFKILVPAIHSMETIRMRLITRIVGLLDEHRYEICGCFYYSMRGSGKEGSTEHKEYFCKSQQDVWEMYRQCEILLLTCKKEVFQIPVLDMMAAGGIVIAVRSDENPRYLRNGINCLLYTSDDAQEAVDDIYRISEDEAYREYLISNAKKTAAEYDWEQIDPEVINLYTKAGE